jgi:uncharacterized delta-60 repeat protein
LPEKGKPCAKPLTVGGNITKKRKKLNNKNKKMKKIYKLFLVVLSMQVYAQDGALDTSFGIGGKVITSINNDERANSLVIQSDGKIVIAGYTFSSISGNDIACVRYNTDGSIDNTFGLNGVATFDIQSGSDDKSTSIDIQSDGKLVLCGFSDDGSDKSSLLMRLNINGTLDTTFGSSGKVLTNFTTTGISIRQDEYRVVKVHPLTGNIVAAGTSFSTSTNSRMIIARYTSVGILDSTFATGGKFISLPNTLVSSTYLASIEDLAIKSNGKISIVGNSLGYFYLGRLNSNGTMDTSFSSDGFNDNFQGRMFGIELNNDDSIYFTGDIIPLPQTQAYTGYIDGIGGGGSIAATTYDFGTTFNAYTYAVEKDNDGKLLVGGYLQDTSTGQNSFLIGRLLANRTRDTSFGNNGFVTTAFTSNDSRAFDLKIQPNGRIVLAGISGGKIALARYINGALSATEFSNNKKSFKIYPNPTSTVLNINTSETIIAGTEYRIIDLSSRLLCTGILNEQGTIAVDNLKSGMYIISIDGFQSIKFTKN